ncbi:MAG: S-layer homology domain-containing protein [Oscillospiraceae bacterium]|nr:S-layer homology domain-containing protein [Oscillospiraceae bacterium]
MRKHFKRFISALLVVVMILAMLPTLAYAMAETYEGTPIDGIPDGDTAFIIYNAENGVAMGAEATGGKSGGVKADGNEENSNLKLYSGTGVYKLIDNGDGTYYLTCGGRFLTATATNAFEFKDAKSSDAKWRINKATGGYYIQSTTKSHSSGPATIEVYNSAFSPYGFDGSTNAAIFTMKFYEVDERIADSDGDGFMGVRPVAGELPVEGDKVVIYNDNGGMCFGPQSDDTAAPSITGVESWLEGNELDIGNGARIYTVHVDGAYYAFENDGKYLRTSENEMVDGKVNNKETLYMDALDKDYSWWKLEEVTGGYIMYNKTAKYRTSSVCVEYFSNSFSGWTYNGSTQLFAMRFFKVEDEYNLGYILNPRMNLVAKEAYIGVDYTFEAKLDELTKVSSIEMTYAVDSGTAKRISPVEQDGYDYTFSIPKKELENSKKLTLSGTATNEYGMSYSASVTVNVKDEPIIISVTPAANAATGKEKRPTISANIANCGENPKVVMTIDGIAVSPSITQTKISYTPGSVMAEGRHTVDITITRSDSKKAEMTWSFFIGEAGISPYFGQIHSHTAEYSDGAGTLEDAYEHAMAADDVDYMIVTDHSNYFDTTATATTDSYYNLSKLTMGQSLTKWEEARATALQYDKMRDDFVCAYGYEMTWSGGPGHTNSFNTYGTVSRNNGELNNKTNYAGMHRYNDLMVNANRGLDINGNPVEEGVKTKYIEDAPVVSQFNHPGTTFGTFDEFAGFNPTRDTVLCLIEVGNGEGKVGGSSYWPSYSEYDKCLAKGWHVAPTNNQDNHKGKWGDANTCRDVILTDDFTEAGLYRAMAERRVYATEDQNLHIYYYLNGEIMGSIIDTGDTELDKITIVCSISDPDGEKLSKVEVIGENGIAIKTYYPTGSTFELNEEFKNTQAYYYIKVTEADGDIACTAPVWVGIATPITADIRTDAALSVEGEEETITATVDNAADYDYELEKVVFYLTDNKGNETIIKTINVDKAEAVIAPGEARTFEFIYERTIAGEQEIKVVFYGEYNDKEFKCRASMKQKVYKAEELVKVAVDYGHGNFYVSGGYSDNMGNFIKYCADNGVMAEFIQKGEFNYNTLKQYRMVVLTVPFDSGNLSPSVYTADELAAIKYYAEHGGNIIVCSKSDRKSPKGDLNCANLSNSILNAIGSNVRVADGIIVDNAMKANEAYRIYFSGRENLNMEHRFIKAAYTSSNSFGTIPSTTNSTGFQLYNGAPILINSGAENKVTTLVRGYTTTWGASYEANFDGSTYVPDYENDVVTAAMGDVNIMTYEDLPGGGWLITCGCTFFSNYDIKDDVDYTNKFIVRNILRELTDDGQPIKVSQISTVKKVTRPATETGDEYTIEGYVTSNASAFDQDTAFFDCIYIQDKKGNGINAFPVAGNFAIGMNVRAHGGVTYYCGEVELNLSTDYGGYCEVISDTTYVIPPKEVDCKTAMSDAEIGNLLMVKGIVTGIHKTEGVIDKIYVRDAAGEACLFINGYIMKNYKGLNGLKVGMMVKGVGIGSRDVDETSATSAIFERLRVRDRREIEILDNGTVHSDLLFKDVKEKDWFYDYVLFAVDRGLLNGTANSTFSPNSNLTRAMVATVLHRMAGEPKADGAKSFDDVESGTWYFDAVSWASAVGIVNGYEDETFHPNAYITRQEMALMLARYATEYMGLEIDTSGNLNAFLDGTTVAEWAEDEIKWFVCTGIMTGMDGRIVPNGTATRAQFATIITRFVKFVENDNTPIK